MPELMMPSEDEMLKSLSEIALERAEEEIELQFRRRYPHMDHEDYLEMTSSPVFWRMYRTSFLARKGIVIFRLIMEAQLKKASKGDLAASRFLFEQLGLSDGVTHKEQPKITVELFLDKMAKAIGDGLRPQTLPGPTPTTE
jgi:hypothetical protein